jgi:hypothetical protein
MLKSISVGTSSETLSDDDMMNNVVWSRMITMDCFPMLVACWVPNL